MMLLKRVSVLSFLILHTVVSPPATPDEASDDWDSSQDYSDLSNGMYLLQSFDSHYIRDADTWCRSTLPGLPKLPRVMCNTFPRATVLMAYEGNKMGIENCLQRFKGEKWRCEGLGKDAKHQGLMRLFEESEATNPIMATSSKEQAIVEAFVGAGAALSVARACGDGYLATECSCGQPKEKESRDNIELEGCHHNFKVGYDLAMDFLSTLFKSLAKRQSQLFLLTKHNVALGVDTAMRTHQTKCACHGESGACSIKTCWIQAQDMKTIGNTIKRMYLSSKQVEVMKGRYLVYAHDGNTKKPIKVPFPAQGGSDPLNSPGLVHANVSYDYCYPNPINSGMSGRFCEPGVSDSACNLFCCMNSITNFYEAAFERKKVTEFSECNCKFNFCCSVECETCPSTEMKRICK